jgi:DNA polymerase-3 subunit gamma/tau
MSSPAAALLEFLAARYLQARRVTDELRSRLGELEQATGWEVVEPQSSGHTLTKDRVRRSIERSTITSAERSRALELVLSSCVAEALPLLRSARSAAVEHVAPIPEPVFESDVDVPMPLLEAPDFVPTPPSPPSPPPASISELDLAAAHEPFVWDEGPVEQATVSEPELPEAVTYAPEPVEEPLLVPADVQAEPGPEPEEPSEPETAAPVEPEGEWGPEPEPATREQDPAAAPPPPTDAGDEPVRGEWGPPGISS